MKRITIDPLTRVEGDLSFEIDCDENGMVTNAMCKGQMYRGFEVFLKGMKPIDALAVTPRICGMCSSAHSYVASNALRELFKIDMPANGYHVKNIVLGTENVQNHFTHFYVLFAPDLAHKKYKDKPMYDEVKKRFAIGGSSYRAVIDVRNDFMNLMGIFGGRWPHNLAMQPGGTTQIIDDSLRLNYGYDTFLSFKEKVEAVALGATVEDWLSITSVAKLESFLESQETLADVPLFIKAGKEFGLNRIGSGPENFLSTGGYDLFEGDKLFKSGFYDGAFKDFDQKQIHEAVSHSHFTDESAGHPFEEDTVPDHKRGYSWIKASRYEGKPFEVGPLARMIIDKDPLILELFNKEGASVWLRTIARFQEGLRTLPLIGEWIQALEIGKPNINHWDPIDRGEAIGFGPAGRGMLGHWIKVDEGVIQNYQVITPTAINGSPKDDEDNPGPMESAIIGTSVESRKDPVEVLHIVRSFDPCLVCSCHVLPMK